MKINRLLCALIYIVCICMPVIADDSVCDNETNNWGGKLIKSPFGLGLDLQTKYVWRGMEMMTEDSAPVLFPSFNYSFKGLYVYAMGAYAVNGKYAEVDLGISYTWNGLSVGFNDYYYPTVNNVTIQRTR